MKVPLTGNNKPLTHWNKQINGNMFYAAVCFNFSAVGTNTEGTVSSPAVKQEPAG